MKRFGTVFLFFVTLLALFISTTGFLADINFTARIFQILFLPITLFLVWTSINHVINNVSALERGRGLKRFLVYYCFVVAAVQVIIGFLSASTIPQFVSAILFSSLGIYFLLLVWPHAGYAVGASIPVTKVKASLKEAKNFSLPGTKIDVDRRDFLKLIGAAGILAFLFGLFSKKVPFFSNTPAIGAASLLDQSGKKINPAQQSATDNYSISEIDDSTSTAYFGFINEQGQWYIMKEDAGGAFRYVKGDGDFESNWAVRDELSYNYFNNVF
jgi:hypothetical protein